MRVNQRYTQWQWVALRVCSAVTLFLLIASMVPVAVQGQPDAPALASDPFWRAQYWNNRDLSGDPVLQRDETEIDYNWKSGSPDEAVDDNRFSARWTRYFYLEAGRYRFEARSDDGVRVYVNDQRIINGWWDHGVQTFSATLNLGTGHHLVRVEYYENSGAAVVRFGWERVSSGSEPNVQNWRGEYFNNRDLNGSPRLVRDDREIDFNWGSGSPASEIDSDNFSVRWQRSLGLDAGNYRFEITVDDGARLWVNNQLLIDEWREQGTTTYRQEVFLPGGSIPVRLEYFERNGNARIRLKWSRTNQASEPESRGWRGEYFNNRDLIGIPLLVRDDREIDFDWGSGAPDGRISSDNFSVRWIRIADFSDGDYRFTAEADDGLRLFIDDRLVIDEWHEHDGRQFTYETHLKGVHLIRVEYFERQGSAFAKLNWKRLKEKEPSPVANLITCVPPQPQNYAWIKLYRLDGNNKWYSIARGIGSVAASGYLKIDGLPVDINRFGNDGEPYKIEQWIGGKVAQSTGDFYAGQPEFRMRSFADNYTPWQCN